jgi:protein-S-isoprenylcysteine O-methyltransferase Ste14
MAKGLLKRRIRDTRLAVLPVVALLFLSEPIWNEYGLIHEPFEYVGYALVIVCVVGRIWCSAYVGGYKNTKLIDTGPFSIVRNPLYVFSFLGLLGIGLITVRLSIAALLCGAFVCYYSWVVEREESHLAERFGDTYQDYKRRVPRWLPRFSLYHSEDEITTRPSYILRTIRDSLWFFATLPAIKAIEYMQVAGWIKPLFKLP